MYDEKNFLYESFKMYYDNARKAQANGNPALAKRNLLLAAEALYKLAKTDTKELREARIKRADNLVDMAKSIDAGKSVNFNNGGNNFSRGNGLAQKNSEDENKQWSAAEIPNIGFKDVAGLEDVKNSIAMLMINPVKYPEKYAAYGKKSGGGVLLYGPPGTGKTMIAKAIAHEVGATFYAIKGSDIVSKWVGESERNISSLFEAARKQKLAIIFIDEMDSLFGKRGNDPHNDKRVNEFLQQIDGFAGKNPNLLLLGATNRPWDVDGAAVRSGRFSQKIYVPLPDKKAREYLFKLYLKNTPVDPSVNISALVNKTENYSGADIAEICDRAKEEPLKAYIATNNMIPLKMCDFENAIAAVTPMVDLKEIEKFENYAGIKKSAYKESASVSTSIGRGANPFGEAETPKSAPEIHKTEPEKSEIKDDNVKLLYEKEIRLEPGKKPVFMFYIEGNYPKIYISVSGKKYICEKSLMNWISEEMDITEGGKVKIEIFADKKIAEAEVNVIKGMAEDDLDI